MKSPKDLQLNPREFEFRLVSINQGAGCLPTILVSFDNKVVDHEIVPNAAEARKIGNWFLKFADYSEARFKAKE